MYYDGTMKYYNERCPQSHIIVDFSFCCWDVIPYGEGVRSVKRLKGLAFYIIILDKLKTEKMLLFIIKTTVLLY